MNDNVKISKALFLQLESPHNNKRIMDQWDISWFDIEKFAIIVGTNQNSRQWCCKPSSYDNLLMKLSLVRLVKKDHKMVFKHQLFIS